MSSVRCLYCKQPRDFSTDLHGCRQSLKAQTYLSNLIDRIKADQERPGNRELTSLGMKAREDRRHQTATSLSLMGLPVRPEYQQNGNE